MRRSKVVKALLLAALGMLLAMPAYSTVHELGHYTAATVFGAENIKGISLDYSLAGLVSPRGHFFVSYKEPWPFGYAPWQAVVVALAGPGVEFLLAVAAVVLLGRWRNPALAGFAAAGVLTTMISGFGDYALVVVKGLGMQPWLVLSLLFLAIVAFWLWLARRLFPKEWATVHGMIKYGKHSKQLQRR